MSSRTPRNTRRLQERMCREGEGCCSNRRRVVRQGLEQGVEMSLESYRQLLASCRRAAQFRLPRLRQAIRVKQRAQHGLFWKVDGRHRGVPSRSLLSAT